MGVSLSTSLMTLPFSSGSIDRTARPLGHGNTLREYAYGMYGLKTRARRTRARIW